MGKAFLIIASVLIALAGLLFIIPTGWDDPAGFEIISDLIEYGVISNYNPGRYYLFALFFLYVFLLSSIFCCTSLIFNLHSLSSRWVSWLLNIASVIITFLCLKKVRYNVNIFYDDNSNDDILVCLLLALICLILAWVLPKLSIKRNARKSLHFDFSRMSFPEWPVEVLNGILGINAHGKKQEKNIAKVKIKNIQDKGIDFIELGFKCFDILKKPINATAPILLRYEKSIAPGTDTTLTISEQVPAGTRYFLMVVKAVVFADGSIKEFKDDPVFQPTSSKEEISHMANFRSGVLYTCAAKHHLPKVPKYFYHVAENGVWTCAYCGTRNPRESTRCSNCSIEIEHQSLCEKQLLLDSYKTEQEKASKSSLRTRRIGSVILGIIISCFLLSPIYDPIFKPFDYSVISGGIKINRYVGWDSEVRIPEELDGYPVIEIGESAFVNRRNIETVILPDSLIKIGNNAFGYCEGLSSIEIPRRVVTIGEYAFNGCSSLSSIRIPLNVERIGRFAFFGCISLWLVECEASSQPPSWNGAWLGETNVFVNWNKLF